jgi:hypothetical protein
MKYLVLTQKSYKQIYRHVTSESSDSISSDIQFLYDQFYESAKKIQVSSINRPLISKLQIQRLRFLLNRLLYLTPYSNYSQLLNLAPEIVDFHEYRVLLNSLINKSVNELIKIPGPAISTFASVFQELNMGKISLDSKLQNNRATLDSVSTLVAFGVLTAPTEWIDQWELNDREYIRFCSFDPIKSRVLNDFSYEDEMRTLQLNSNSSLRQSLMSTRFSDLEKINLDALTLSDDGY